MKKLFLLLVVVVLTASVNAQEKKVITANKTFDNWYVGFYGGVATPMKEKGDAGLMKGFSPNVGLRLGKNLNTVFGVAIDANAFFESDEKSMMKTSTFIDDINLGVLGTFNLSNIFGGYKGEPRSVEFIALGGFGWTHQFGASANANGINSKVAVDLTFNLGKSRAVQFFIEPAIVFGLWDDERISNVLSSSTFNYNIRSALLQLNLGMNFKFGTSNGTKNFTIARLRDQSEIDDLNARINELRDESDSKDRRIARDIRRIAELEDSLEAAKKVKPTVVNKVTKVVNVNNNVLQPSVIFGQGKSSVDAGQMASVAMIAKYMKNHPESNILIKGYASPEGNPELNQKLSVARAQAVKDALLNRYGIPASRLTIQGMGATDELFDELDFNRVATFTDTTK